ncbi:MAG: hypothetical protein ABIZ81_03635 [Opitutaceae bacterium]
MKSRKNVAVALLAVVSIGTATLAWLEHRELVQLRAAALNNAERADLQKRLWDAEKRAKNLADQLAGRRNSGDSGALAIGADPSLPEGASRRVRPAGGVGGSLTTIMSAMDKPEIQQLMALQQKAQLDGKYAALFKKLNLPPEQLDKLKTLLVEKQTAMQDVVAAAHARGINPLADPEGLRKMIADTQAEVENNIKAALGDGGYGQYQEYQQTIPQRALVSQLQQSLSYTQAPLSDSQAEQLIGILSRTSPQPSREVGGFAAQAGVNFTVAVAQDNNVGGGGATFSIGEAPMTLGGPGAARISDEAVTAAQEVLSPPQLQGLQQLQQQQQAQQQLQQTLRQSLGSPRRSESGTIGSSAQPAPAAR